MAEMFDQAPELPPPFLNIPGIANFRDIGGYGTNNQQSIRRNLIFRSADPSKVQPAGLERLKELGIEKVFDLRSVPEIQRQGPEWKGVAIDASVFVTKGEDNNHVVEAGQIERIWCPVFRNQDYGPEQVALRFKNYASNGTEGFVKAYRDILNEGHHAYKTILLHLAQPQPTPCLIHCTAGKDRTGIIAALLHLLCDVPFKTVSYEYSLTDKGLQHLKPLFTERLLKNPALEGNEEGVKNMISSQPEKMADTIEMLEKEFGGAKEYIKNLVGLTEDEICRLKKNVLSDDAPCFSVE